MTRRERLERKAELRREWAEKRASNAQDRFSRAKSATDGIPPGQPILVGHHSEKRHRAALAKHDANMRAGFADSDMAKHHEQKADGIEQQLETSIFSDDPDAIEALEAKAFAIDAACELMKDANRAFKKAKGAPGWATGLPGAEQLEANAKELFRISPYERQPFPSYSLSNARARARQARERIKVIKHRQALSKQAEVAGGCLITGNDYVRVTFSEKPDRDVLNTLKAAGFRWSSGSWLGYRAKLPAAVLSLVR